jgi:hypothetical protein
MEKKFLSHFAVVFLSLNTIPSCVSFVKTYAILERSQKETPLWVQNKKEVFLKQKSLDHKVHVVYQKDFIYNLTLGIKQAQSAAQVKAPQLIFEMITKNASQNFSFLKNFSQNQESSCTQKFLQSVKKISYQNSKILQSVFVQDIYWEYRQRNTDNGPERFYIVWVLLSMSRERYDTALKTIARDLMKSSCADLVTLGKSILEHNAPSPIGSKEETR